MNLTKIPTELLAYIASFDLYSNFPRVSKDCQKATELAAQNLFNQLKASGDCSDIIEVAEHIVPETVKDCNGQDKQNFPIYLERIFNIFQLVIAKAVQFDIGIVEVCTKLMFLGDKKLFYPAVTHLAEVMHWVQEEEEKYYPSFFKILAWQIPEFDIYMQSLKEIKEAEKIQKLKDWLNQNKSILEKKEKLSLNGIKYLPKEIEYFINLKELTLNSNNFTFFPRVLLKLKNLETLELKDNKIGELPKDISSLTNLRFLDLSQNRIEHLDNNITGLKNLEFLYIDQNDLTSLPTEIGSLEKLYSIRAAHNRLTSLPEGLGKLINLNTLCIGNNQLTSLPTEIGTLAQLNFLNVEHNQLSDLPEGIENLKKLNFLHANHNLLTSLPKGIKNLTKLLTLVINNNLLKTLPEEIVHLKSLIRFHIEDNPFESIPPIIVNSKQFSENPIIQKFRKTWLYSLTEVGIKMMSSYFNYDNEIPR